MMERTNEEILARIAKVEDDDWMGIQTSDLLEVLPFDIAKPFLHDTEKAEDWEPLPRDRESVITRMLDYMPFAWGKANDGRGLSAGRSMDHYSAWVWLAGDDLGELTDYEYYGKDNLVKICKHYGFDYSKWDEGIRTNGD